MKDEKRARRVFNITLVITLLLAFLFGFQSAGLIRMLSEQEKLPDWVGKIANSLSYDAHASAPEVTDRDLHTFYEVLAYISQTYLYRDDLDLQEVIHGASSGAVTALGDRYSRFVPPPDQQVLTEEIHGEYAGVGISIIDRPGVLPHFLLDCEAEAGIDPEDSIFLRENRGVVVVQVFANGPAADVGLEADDVIACVDGEPLRGGTANDAVAVIKGPEETNVTITVWRPALQEEFTFDVTRRLIEVPTVGVAEMLDDRIGYIRLDSFNNLSPRDVAISINNLMMEGMEGLIFDLRNNTGGPMEAAAQISDLFIPDGTMVYFEDSQGRRETFTSQDGGDAMDLPLIILTNGNTASASEIVAGAIRDTDTGLLVGETTFGKGVVQGVYTLSDGSGLVLTTGRYLTPDQHEITHDGIEPDILSDLDPDRLREIDPNIDEFLIRMDEINLEFAELREQMYIYLNEHDFQRDDAFDLMNEWLEEGTRPEELD